MSVNNFVPIGTPPVHVTLKIHSLFDSNKLKKYKNKNKRATTITNATGEKNTLSGTLGFATIFKPLYFKVSHV